VLYQPLPLNTIAGAKNWRCPFLCPLGQIAGQSASVKDLLSSKRAPHAEQTKEYKGMITSA